MDNIDSILVGMEPRQLSEKEVRITKTNQEGGEISRRDALTMLRTTGSSNSESRKEYRDAKREARQSGLRGKEMRQAARNAAMTRGTNRILPALDSLLNVFIHFYYCCSFQDFFSYLIVGTSS